MTATNPQSWGELVKSSPDLLEAFSQVASPTDPSKAKPTLKKLLRDYSDPWEITRLSERELSLCGLTKAQARNLSNAFVLTSQLSQQVSTPEKVRMSGDINRIVRPRLCGLDREKFLCVALNRGNIVLKVWELSSGGVSGTVVDIKILLRELLQIPRACAVILAHNHPSNSLEPSTQDRELTRKIYRAVDTVGFKLLDHLIITDTSYLSFGDEGLL